MTPTAPSRGAGLRRSRRPALAVIAAVAALGLLSACTDDGEADRGDGAATTTPVAPTATADTGGGDGADTTTTEPEGGRVIEVTVAGGEVRGVDRRVTVEQGTDVRLLVTSDVVDEVHVHGYDLLAPVGPDATAELEFTADLPGVWEVELEQSHRLLFQLEVT